MDSYSRKNGGSLCSAKYISGHQADTGNIFDSSKVQIILISPYSAVSVNGWLQ